MMTKNFLEVGETYQSKSQGVFECIHSADYKRDKGE